MSPDILFIYFRYVGIKGFLAINISEFNKQYLLIAFLMEKIINFFRDRFIDARNNPVRGRAASWFRPRPETRASWPTDCGGGPPRTGWNARAGRLACDHRAARHVDQVSVCRHE